MANIPSLPWSMPITISDMVDYTTDGFGKGQEDPATGRYESKAAFISGGGIPGFGNGDAYRGILPKGPSYLTDLANSDNQGHAAFGAFFITAPTDNIYVGYVIKFNAGIRVNNASRDGTLGVKFAEIQSTPQSMECRAFTYLRSVPDSNQSFRPLGFRPAEDGGTPYAPTLDSDLKIIGDGSSNDIAGEWIYLVQRINTTTGEHGYKLYRRNGEHETHRYNDYPAQCGFAKTAIYAADCGNTWQSILNTIPDADASYDVAHIHMWSDESPDVSPPPGFINNMFIIAPVVKKGVGTDDERYEADIELSKTTPNQYFRCHIPMDKTVTPAVPRFNWAIVQTNDPTPIGSNLFSIAENLNTELRNISLARRTAINNKLTIHGIDTNSLLGSNTVKDLLRLVLRQLDSSARIFGGEDFG